MQRSYRQSLLAFFIVLIFFVGTVSANPVGTSGYRSMNFLIYGLILTWIIEIPVLLLLLRFGFKERSIPVPRIFVTGIICSLVTLPLFWWGILELYTIPTEYRIGLGELLVIGIEAIIIRYILKTDSKTAIISSFLMNAVSFLLSVIFLLFLSIFR